MKIALLGYGKMGRLIERLALSKGYAITTQMNTSKQDWEAAQTADTWIDFSHGSCVLKHVEKALEQKKNLLIGTTGWEDSLSEVKRLAYSESSAVLYAPNCALGVLLFMRLVEKSAQMLGAFKEYQIGAFEAHHREKKDTPSGTAKKLASLIEKQTGHPLSFTSLRAGHFAGKHEIFFDSPFDTLTLTHEAKSREGFALGALEAAKWLEGKQGFYTLDDYIEEVVTHV